MPTQTQIKDELEKHKEDRKAYKKEGEDFVSSEFFENRKKELQKARQNILGVDLEEIWRAADRAYVPHTLKTAKQKGFASDDELGWRSVPITLGTETEWQEDSVPTNPYVKIQTALAILVDRNPRGVFKAHAKKFEQASLIHKELYNRNWDVANSKEQLKLVILNGAKYGVITGFTSPLKIQRNGRNLIEYFPENPKNNKYEDIVNVVYDDVYRWALNPWLCWFDDMARPGDVFSVNDWLRYKDFSWDRIKEIFKGFKNFKFVIPKQITEPDEQRGKEKPERSTREMIRLWYYENLSRDMFYVQTDDGVVLINEPIPREPKNKRLSCWVAPWTLRHDETIYGIGLYEAMRNDYKLYIKVRNMTVDQIVLSIYKEWFYEGTNTLTDTGEMRIRPGVGRQVTNAKNITWNEVPGPGQDAWKALEFIENKIDDSTGITKTLEGELSPKAKAFDIAQAREASLKRLKTPMDNIGFALEQDAYISVGLFEELYSIPEIETILDPEKIEDYKGQVARGELDSELVEETTVVEGEEETEALNIKTFRTFPLNIERDEQDNVVQTREERFFDIRPADLQWEGIIHIAGQSILPESPLLERQEIIEMFNIIGQLLLAPPEIYLKPIKQILKKYNQEPEDWLPDAWLQLEEGETPQQPLFTQQGQGQGKGQQPQAPQSIVPQGQAGFLNRGRQAIKNFAGRSNPLNPQQ